MDFTVAVARTGAVPATVCVALTANVDPEAEYKALSDAIGGQFIEFSFNIVVVLAFKFYCFISHFNM